MKKQIIICDRCKEQVMDVEQIRDLKSGGDKDLCFMCYQAFQSFMSLTR